jgi:NADH dehydrogenase (ubiquinone) Fe-S protein 4
MNYNKLVNIYKKPKLNQSGEKDTWVLDFSQDINKYINPVMGWSGSFQVSPRINFDTKEEAINFAKKNNYKFLIYSENNSKKIKPKTYAQNFLTKS